MNNVANNVVNMACLTEAPKMVYGEGVVKFVEKDPEDGHTYLHHFTRREVWDFIEINFLLSGCEGMRALYYKRYKRDFLSDYYLLTRYGVDVGEPYDGPFINRCLKTFGVEDIVVLDVKIPVFPTYVLSEDDTWIIP